MFLLKDTPTERFFGILSEHFHCSLRKDRPGIKTLIHIVDRAAGNFDAILKSLLLRMQAREARQQRRMDIQNPACIGRNEIFTQQSHVPGQTDEIHARLFQNRNYLTIKICPLYAFGIESKNRQTLFVCIDQPGSIGNIRDHASNLCR